MKKMMWMVLAILLLLAGCDNAVNAPDPTEQPIAHTTEDPTPLPTHEPTPAPVADAAYEITNVYVKTWKNSIGTVCAKAIAEITNTGGKNLYLSSGSVDLEDASGALVDVMNSVSAYPQVICLLYTSPSPRD